MNPREDLYKGYKMPERQIAHKVAIKWILEGKYVKEEGWEPNYILSKDGVKISRVNLIGTIISKEDGDNFVSVVLDDGSGKISVRTFEQKGLLVDLKIGDTVLVIGRPREYGERYVLLEILKKLQDNKWIKIRKLELGKVEPRKIEVSVEENVETKQDSVADNVIECIKRLDSGEGVDFEVVLEQVKGSKEVVDALLKEGDVFEVKPGRLKVLE